MRLRTISTMAIGASLLAAATAFAPAAHAGNVAWSVSIGGPGFAVAAGQPGYGGAYYGGNRYYGAPYHRYYRSWYRPVAVLPPVPYVPPQVVFPYYAPAPVVVAPAPRVYAPRPIAWAHGYAVARPGYASY